MNRRRHLARARQSDAVFSFSCNRFCSGDVLKDLRYESRCVANFSDALQATRNVLGLSPLLKNSALTVKTVRFRIISIVRVPSLCFNKDTHDNFDDEL